MLELRATAVPEDAADAESGRGYTRVPTYDVERYVSQQTVTFAWGLTVGIAMGTLLGQAIRGMRAPGSPAGLFGLRGRRRRRGRR